MNISSIHPRHAKIPEKKSANLKHCFSIPDIPYSTMTLEEAKDSPLKLMEERKAFVEDAEQDMIQLTFSFCEHQLQPLHPLRHS